MTGALLRTYFQLSRPPRVHPRRWLARSYRRALGRVVFIGVTGSCGKTTAKELIAAVLAGRDSGRKSGNQGNGPGAIAETILTVHPWHRFCVHELCGARPGALAPALELLRPQVGVVTNVGQDHYTMFRTLEATAAEKGTLVEVLPEHGTAILNADDPRVLAMRERTRAGVITYGLAEAATVRGSDLTSRWPDRLSLTVTHGEDRVRVRTRLLGEQWASSVLAALATGVSLGVPLEDAARSVERVEPVYGRMSPHATRDGVTFVLDSWKAPLWTVPAALRFLDEARARRKLVVIGMVSDSPVQSAHKYRTVARRALEVAEKAFFVGDFAHCALKARSHPGDDRILAFETVYELSRFLRDELARGDLVLVKGTQRVDHLERLVLERTDGLDCWRERCGRSTACAQCELRGSPFVPVSSAAATPVQALPSSAG